MATIYLATPIGCCYAELDRALADQARGAISFPREIHEIHVHELTYVDLTHPVALDAVGLTDDDIADPDWAACQRVGNAVQYLGITGLLAPSATGVGNVLAVYEPHLRPGQLQLASTELLQPPTPP